MGAASTAEELPAHPAARRLTQATVCNIAHQALLDANPICAELDVAVEEIKRKLISADQEDPDDRDIATEDEMDTMCQHICYDRLKPVVIAQKDCFIEEMIAGRGAPLVKDGKVLTARELNGELALDLTKKVSAMSCGKQPALGDYCVAVRTNYSVPDYGRRVANPSFTKAARDLMCEDLLAQGCCLHYSVPEEFARAVVEDYVLLDTPTGATDYTEVLQSLKTPMEISCGFGEFPKSDCETEAEDLEGNMRSAIEGRGDPVAFELRADLVLDGVSRTYPYEAAPTFYIQRDVTLTGFCGTDGTVACRLEAGTRQRRLFEVSPEGSLTLGNVRVIAGRTVGWGGGARIVHGSARFRGVQFESLHADRGGGAVQVSSGGTAHFDNCLFRGSSSLRPGGGVAVVGASRANFSACAFAGNSARGGGADVWADSTSVVIMDPWDFQASAPEGAVIIEGPGTVTSSATMEAAEAGGCDWNCYLGAYGEFVDRDKICKEYCEEKLFQEAIGCRTDDQAPPYDEFGNEHVPACLCTCQIALGLGYGIVVGGFVASWIFVQLVCSLRWYKYRKVPEHMHEHTS